MFYSSAPLLIYSSVQLLVSEKYYIIFVADIETLK